MTAPTNLTRFLAIRTALASLLAGWLAVYMYMYIYIHIYVLAGWIAGWLYVYIYIYMCWLAGLLIGWLFICIHIYIYVCMCWLAGWLAGTWLAPNLPRLGHKTFCKACFGHSTVLKTPPDVCARCGVWCVQDSSHATTWLAPNLPRLGHKYFWKSCFRYSWQHTVAGALLPQRSAAIKHTCRQTLKKALKFGPCGELGFLYLTHLLRADPAFPPSSHLR